MKKIFYIMGTGPSVNDITEEEFEFLKNQHTLGFGGWAYCGIPTEYYMTFEAPNRRIKTVTKDTLNGKFDIKLDVLHLYGNTNTKMLLWYADDIMYALKLGFKHINQVIKSSALFLPSRKGWFMDEDAPPHRFKECRAHNFGQPLFRFRGSLSSAINSALILGAEEIRLIGIDLNCQDDFYMDTKKWITNDTVRDVFENIVLKNREERIESKLSLQKGYDPNMMHSTETVYIDKNRWGDRALRPMSDVVTWMDKELRWEGTAKIYTTSKKSKLYGRLEHKEIMDE